jgi:hypothetical protein
LGEGEDDAGVPPDPAGLAVHFVRLHEFLCSAGDRDAAMRRLVGLAVTAVPGCDWAAVSKGPRSVACSDEVARTADQLQFQAGDGPCLAAALAGGPVHLPDLDNEQRWPQFCAAARSGTPVRAALSFPLEDEPEAAVLSLYGAGPGSLGTGALDTAALFAAHARVLLLHAGSTARAAQLSEALSTSRQIGAAVGILMSLHKITGDEAFDLLRTTSQHLNRKLHLVAEDVTRTGALPETRPGDG